MSMNDGGVGDGGPAFPVSEEEARGKVAGVYGGMTLRDYFAAKALVGCLSNPEIGDVISQAIEAKKEMSGTIGETCFAIADALLAARGRA